MARRIASSSAGLFHHKGLADGLQELHTAMASLLDATHFVLYMILEPLTITWTGGVSGGEGARGGG
jgi:hypothetical protein